MAFRSNENWQPVNIGSGSSPPSTGYTARVGDLWMDSTAGAQRLLMNDGSAWVAVGGRAPGVAIRRTSNQGISHGADTYASFQTADFNRISASGTAMWSSSNPTYVFIREDGWYVASFTARFQAGGGDGERYAGIVVNDFNTRIAGANNSYSAPDMVLNLTAVRYCTVGESLRCMVYQASSSTLNLSTAFGGTNFYVAKVAN